MNSKNNPPKRLAVLISGNGSNLQAIIEHQKKHSTLYQIVLVISNQANAYGLVRAQKAQIETIFIDHTQFDSREAFDAKLQAAINTVNVDLIVLAGFMRILSAGFTRYFLGRLINIHPSLLPKYTGLNTHQRALDAEDKTHGLSVHFVTTELDSGPVILQVQVMISFDDNEDSLKQKVHQQEYLAYPLVIEWFMQENIELKHNQVWLNKVPLIMPEVLEQTIPN